MHALRFLFSPAGRLAPQPFAIAVIVVYAAGLASHFLTTPDVMVRAGLWLFVAAQAALVWIWIALHAKRLRDSGRGAGLAVGVAILYVLALALLIVVTASFFTTASGQVPDGNAAGALGLLLIATIIAVVLGSAHYDAAWLMVAVLTLIACLPVIVAVAFTCWTATRPSLASQAA